MPRQVWNLTKIIFFAAVFKLFYQLSVGKFLYTSWVTFQGAESVTWKLSAIKMFLKKIQNLLENTCARVFFLTMLQDVLKRDFSTGLSLLIFWKFLRTATFCATSKKICFWRSSMSGHLQITAFHWLSFLIVSRKKLKIRYFLISPPAHP